MSIIKEFVHNESFLALRIHLSELLTSFRIHIENYFRHLILTFGVYCCVQLDGQRAHLPLKVIILFSLPVCNSVKNSLVQSVPASTYMCQEPWDILDQNAAVCFMNNKEDSYINAMGFYTVHTLWHSTHPNPVTFPQIHTITQKPMFQRLTLKEAWWSCREISTTTIIGNTTMSAVITSWESLTKWQTITFITNGSDKLPWLPTEFISSQQWV